jgi:DNA-binding GntR family transcriptional regulator
MRHSLADKAYEILQGEILTCAVKPEQQIVQSQLAERYQVGTTPIREALQRLAQGGFVQPIPRFGYIVNPTPISDVHKIYELRSIVESAVARLAAVRGSQEQLNNLD